MNIDNRFQFVHETQQTLPHSEHVVSTVSDHGYTGGNECDKTYVLSNVMNEEDAELLKAILRRHTVPSMFFIDRKSTRLNSSHITRSRMPSSA